MRKRWLRRILLALGLVSGAVVATACHPPATIVTPQGKAAYTADQVVQRIGEFQQAVIDASDAGKIKVQDARQIVGWCLVSLKAIQNAPTGWQTVAQSGWDQVRPLVAANATLGPWAPIVDVLLSGGF